MHINWQLRELNLKIVYYGPALSGKTTNLEQIYKRVDPQRRSELISLKTHEDRTLFFDFLQLELGKVGGMLPKIHLYTVPGQTYYEASRRVVLRGADGIVFVADSDPARLKENRQAWADMYKHLRTLNIPEQSLPIVVQFNKQDLRNALSPATLRVMLNVNNLPILPAVALTGEGVLETLKTVTRGVMAMVQQQVA